jgi:hypothetical protein
VLRTTSSVGSCNTDPATDQGSRPDTRSSGLSTWECTADIRDAITREKQIKRWSRRKKVALIESTNPGWIDLAENWRDGPGSLPG